MDLGSGGRAQYRIREIRNLMIWGCGWWWCGVVVGLPIRQPDVTAYYVVLWTLWQPILRNGGLGIHVEIFISCITMGQILDIEPQFTHV